MATKKVANKSSKDTTKNTTIPKTPPKDVGKALEVWSNVPEESMKVWESYLVEQADQLQVIDNESCEVAIEIRSKIKTSKKAVDGVFGKLKTKAYAAYKAVQDTLNLYTKPLDKADKILQGKVKDYVDEQKRLREEERRLEEQRRLEKAEEERIKLAQKLQEQGRQEEAIEVLDSDVQDVVDVPKPSIRSLNTVVPEVDGRTLGRDKWIGEVYDKEKFVKAVAAGTIPLQAVDPNQRFLDGMAKQFMDTDALSYPGVRVRKE